MHKFSRRRRCRQRRNGEAIIWLFRISLIVIVSQLCGFATQAGWIRGSGGRSANHPFVSVRPEFADTGYRGSQRGRSPHGWKWIRHRTRCRTKELAQQVAESIEKQFSKKPYLMIVRSNRRFLGPNRPPENAYEDPDSKPVYDACRAALTKFCRDVRNKFHKGLLFDIHGQGAAKEPVFRGT